MVLTGTNGKRYSIQFQHTKLAAGTMIKTVVHGHALWTEVTHRTNAAIYEAPWKKGSEPLATAEAHCSKADQFTRAEGRQTAFTRMLNDLFPGPENAIQRGALWASYWQKVGDLKPRFPLRAISNEDKGKLQEVLEVFIDSAEGNAPNSFGVETITWAKDLHEKLA